jgi:hypothetical protein
MRQYQIRRVWERGAGEGELSLKDFTTCLLKHMVSTGHGVPCASGSLGESIPRKTFSIAMTIYNII